LAFDKEGRLIFPNTTYRLINITGRLPQAPDLKAYIDSKVQPLLALRSEVLGQAQTNFEKDWLTTPWDSALGDLISDAIYESGKKYGAQISFENRGGIRGRIEKGPVTEELVEELLPFDNRLTVATISGTALLNILEHSVSTTLGGKFLDVHGLKFAYTKKGEPGHRIVFALSQNPEGRTRKPLPIKLHLLSDLI
jgi:2',3'-cyclic-nucleotide 2'-phosphodiesterase (5'-nucleotidase family)